MCCHSFRTRLYIRLILLFSSLTDMKTAAASSAVESELEKTLVHFTSFPLPSVFLCQAFLTVALRAPLWQIMCSHNTMPTPLCKSHSSMINTVYCSPSQDWTTLPAPAAHHIIILLQSRDTKSMGLIRQDSAQEFLLSHIIMYWVSESGN